MSHPLRNRVAAGVGLLALVALVPLTTMVGPAGASTSATPAVLTSPPAAPTDSSTASATDSSSVSATDTTGVTPTATGTPSPSDTTSTTASSTGSATDSGSASATPTDSASPTDSSSSPPVPVWANVTFGCANDGFVEVTLASQSPDATTQETYQVGLAGPDSTTSSVYPEGGPSLVTLSTGAVTVRLAGPVGDNDHIFVTQVDTGDTQTFPLAEDCRPKAPRVPSLATPTLSVTPSDCAGTDTAGAAVTVSNPNTVNSNYKRVTGLTSVDYTLLLVQTDNSQLADQGTLVRFTAPDTNEQCLAPPPSIKLTNFVVRAIGVDGSSAESPSIQLGTAITHSTSAPAPSSAPVTLPTGAPTQHVSKPVTKPISSPATKPVSAPSSAAVSNPSSVSGSNSGNGSSTGIGSGGSGSGGSGITANGQGVGSSSTSATTSVSGSPSARPTPTASVPRTGPTTVPGSVFGDTGTTKILADPPLDTSTRIFVWQRDIALVVALDAVAIGALIGGVVWAAKRR